MLHRTRVAARATRVHRVVLSISLAICATQATGANTSPQDAHDRFRGLTRTATSYCSYELGDRLFVEAINNRNQIVGTALLDGDLAQAFIWDWQRGVRLLGVTPGASISLGRDINDRGQVVGISGGPFIWDEARGMRVFATLDGESVSVTHINNLGHIIGLSSTAAEDGEHLYFREPDGDVLDLGAAKIPFGVNDLSLVGYSIQKQQPPPASDVFIAFPYAGARKLRGFPPERLIFPEALNNFNHIVGSFLGHDQLTHAMRWTPRRGMEELTMPDGVGFSNATDVNVSGTVVGYMELGFPLLDSFVWQERSGLRDLRSLINPTSPSVPQADAMEPGGINDRGWIVVNTGPRGGPYTRPYVLVPKFEDDGSACGPPPPTSP